MNYSHSSTLQSLREAIDAYEAKPDLEKRIADLEAKLLNEQQAYSGLQEHCQSTVEKLKETEAKLKSVTEERDEFSFRSLELTERLENVSKLLGLELPKQPTVASEVEAEAQRIQDRPFAASSSGANTTTSATSNTMGANATGSVSSSPTSITTTSGPEQSDTNVGQSDTRPTDQNVVEPIGGGSTTSTSGEGHGSDRPLSSASSQSGSDQATVNNQVGSTPDTPIASEKSASTGDNVHTMSPIPTTTEQRHKGKPSWMKPVGMSWKEWKDEGGYIPDWVSVA